MKTRNITLPLLLLIMSVLPCGAQKIKTDTPVIDVGQTEYYHPATASFVLKNAGKRPLEIYKVDTGCNCIAAHYPSEPVPPGEKFNINITYDARLMGHFDKITEVYSNASSSPLTLEMRGVVVEKAEDYSGRYPFRLGELTADCNAVDFDDVYKGEILTQRFHIFNPTSKTVNPQILHLPAYLKAEISPSDVAPGRSALVTLTLDTRNMHNYGYERTQIYLGANLGERVSANKEIEVGITLLPPLQELTPAQKTYAPRLKLSETAVKHPVADGKKKSSVVSVQNTGKTTLEIYSMRMMAEGIQVSLDKRNIEAGETAKMKIKTDPKKLKNTKRMPRIVLITNDPEQPKATIDIDIN